MQQFDKKALGFVSGRGEDGGGETHKVLKRYCLWETPNTLHIAYWASALVMHTSVLSIPWGLLYILPAYI